MLMNVVSLAIGIAAVCVSAEIARFLTRSHKVTSHRYGVFYGPATESDGAVMDSAVLYVRNGLRYPVDLFGQVDECEGVKYDFQTV